MKKEPNIKIFVTHFNKRDYIYEDDIFVPIQAWKKNSKIDLWIQWDDIWDNISERNSQYAELTTQYWVWKNYDLSDVDYVWFCHYRRYPTYYYNVSRDNVSHFFDWFMTKFNFLKEHNYIANFSGKYIKNSSISIKQFIKSNNYDIFLTNRDFFVNPLVKITDFVLNIAFPRHVIRYRKLYLLAVETFLHLYPNYENDLRYTQFSLRYNHRNIFIMKKDLFLEYSKWLFDYFFLLEKNRVNNGVLTPERWVNKRWLWIHWEIFINIRSRHQEKLWKRVSYDANLLFFNI